MADVHVLENSADKEANRIPSDCYFLDEDTVLAYKRNRGDGRYPYACDGRTLWAYSSGNLSVEESLYNVFLDAREGKEPFLCFFAGRKEAEGYFPISLYKLQSLKHCLLFQTLLKLLDYFFQKLLL